MDAPYTTTARCSDGTFYGAVWRADNTLAAMSDALPTRGKARHWAARRLVELDRDGTLKSQYVECGCCGHFHTPEFRGDCRDDANRFTADQLDAKHGANGWDYLDLETQMENEASA